VPLAALLVSAESAGELGIAPSTSVRFAIRVRRLARSWSLSGKFPSGNVRVMFPFDLELGMDLRTPNLTSSGSPLCDDPEDMNLPCDSPILVVK
jgi:hypothetical protein